MDDNSEVLFCRICLRIDLTHKYILSDIAQRKFIEKLFKENGYHKDLEKHSYACFECRSVLHRSYNFIQKALRAQKALYELQEKQELLTNTVLQNVDRKKYNITSNLACCASKTHFFDPLDNKSEDREDNKSKEIENNITKEIENNETKEIENNKTTDTEDNKTTDTEDNKTKETVDNKTKKTEKNKTKDTEDNKTKETVDNKTKQTIDNKTKQTEHSKNKETKDNLTVKVEIEVDTNKISPSPAQDNLTSLLDSPKSKIDPNINMHKELTVESEFWATDTEFIPNIVNNVYTDSNLNEDVKAEPEIFVKYENDGSGEEYNYLENIDPFSNNKTNSPEVVDISSDETTNFNIHILKEAMKRREKRKEIIKKKKKKCKSKVKSVKQAKRKSKVTLDLFSSDEEVKKRKRTKVVWPEMPVFEERFRTRKNVNYSVLADDNEEDVEQKPKKVKKDKVGDGDFVPTGEESSDESYDSYDDEGKPKRRENDTRVFPMECEECDTIVISKTDHRHHYLKSHIDVEYPYRTDDVVLCQHCGLTVTRRRQKDHDLKHAGIKFTCDICHKEYSNKQAMQVHQKRVHHVGRRPQCICDYCQMSFFAIADLKRHIRTHTGEKPFKCHLCDYRVAHKGNLYVHIRQFHQHMQINTKKKQKDSEDTKKKKKVVKKDKETLNEENVEENSGKGRKRKLKDNGKKKRKKRRRKVVTDSDTE